MRLLTMPNPCIGKNGKPDSVQIKNSILGNLLLINLKHLIAKVGFSVTCVTDDDEDEGVAQRYYSHPPSHADLSRANLGATLPPDGRGGLQAEKQQPKVSGRHGLTQLMQVSSVSMESLPACKYLSYDMVHHHSASKQFACFKQACGLGFLKIHLILWLCRALFTPLAFAI